MFNVWCCLVFVGRCPLPVVCWLVFGVGSVRCFSCVVCCTMCAGCCACLRLFVCCLLNDGCCLLSALCSAFFYFFCCCCGVPYLVCAKRCALCVVLYALCAMCCLLSAVSWLPICVRKVVRVVCCSLVCFGVGCALLVGWQPLCGV